MSQLKITLPLPDRDLHPNARVHRMALATKKRQARRLAKVQSFAQVGIVAVKSYRLDFYHATRRNRDEDGAISSCKAYLDGLADCMQQDDSSFKCKGVEFHIDVLSPRLEILIETE